MKFECTQKDIIVNGHKFPNRLSAESMYVFNPRDWSVKGDGIEIYLTEDNLPDMMDDVLRTYNLRSKSELSTAWLFNTLELLYNFPFDQKILSQEDFIKNWIKNFFLLEMEEHNGSYTRDVLMPYIQIRIKEIVEGANRERRLH